MIGTLLQNNAAVLVVDDDEGIRQFLSGVLEREGFRCLLASSVEEAVEAVNNHRVSLVLLDWGLRGGMDTSGAEVLAYSKERFPMLPVVVMSGMAIDVRTDATTKQADGFLAKPFSATLIIAHVNQWLNRVQRTTKTSLPEREEDVVSLVQLEGRYIRHVARLLHNDLPLTAKKLGVSHQSVVAALNGAPAD